MTTLTKKEISSLHDFTDFVEQQTEVHWYRGCENCDKDQLVPTLYRHPTITDAVQLFKQELAILKRFTERAIPYLGSSLKNEEPLSILFSMQHYGVPTRLLDWSENPLIALYFALADVKNEPAQAATIWVVDPSAWNAKALNLDPSPGIISPSNDHYLNGYQPGTDLDKRRSDPVFMTGYYDNPRIVVQRGVFALFGTSTKPMEQTYIDKDYPQDCLVYLFIKAENIASIQKSLSKIGMTDSAVFPELFGLAKEIKRQYGYFLV
ncbi:FRG domain-containing protein [Dehalogenimonas alkenigignens]|uniref:FRG domain-containing protein n=1 Tax=Dehalogenimonas alkenigignens TaxID=1217799 RepID=UPI000D57AA1C|nr:FRG domain-containing protein [Dehalogenimonas alkenigignens]PVV84021.1 hypothetical protein DD509_04955 [Dehalogenimonas alkenigignens]